MSAPASTTDELSTSIEAISTNDHEEGGEITKVDTGAVDKRGEQHDSFWKAIPQDIFCKQVLGLLDRQSVQTLMKLHDVLECFNLGDFFCPEHGTQLSNEESECIDCVMLQIGKRRCPQCDDFELFQLITNHCEMESCRNPTVSCLGCTDTRNCDDCENDYCNDCSGISCDTCETSGCQYCAIPGFQCHVCQDRICTNCNEFVVCEECNKFFCSSDECREVVDYCEGCYTWCCIGCRRNLRCDLCGTGFCSECRDVIASCSECGYSFCIDACVEGRLACCEGCGGWHCTEYCGSDTYS